MLPFTRIGRFFLLFFHLFRTSFQMVYGAWRISKLQEPIITIFGSARMKSSSIYAQKAQELGQRFIDAGISILTGGGPGIMEAAVCHTKYSGKAKSIGIGVRGVEDRPNLCATDYFDLEYFFARKWLLTEFSSGFIIFPGGFGTLDEMAGVLTLIQTKKIKKVPMVLIGKEFWNPFVLWIKNEALVHGAILEEELEYFYVTDNLDEAFCFVQSNCEARKLR
ncbi:MAG: cytokinin riboside 5'-monophosphate phosphoribohydrolase [Candidatus Babeliales bacterium]